MTTIQESDTCSACHCILMEERRRYWTVFFSQFGTFRYICMPFGLSNARSVCSRMLDVAMAHSPSDYWFSEHLKKVIQAHTKTGIKIQYRDRKYFHRKQNETQGHSRRGPDSGQILSRVYRTGHAQRCPCSLDIIVVLIPGVSTTRMNSTKKTEKFEWSGDMERDFKQLIAQFTSRKI